MQLRVEHLTGRLRLSGHHGGGRRTNVRAIEIVTDAFSQLCEFLLGQARVGARGANLCAQRQGIQRIGVSLHVLQIGPRMAAKHGIDQFHGVVGFAQPTPDSGRPPWGERPAVP